MTTIVQRFARALGYNCRGCGTDVPNRDRYKKCPVCGIKW